MLNIKNVKLAYGNRVLLNDATVQVYKGQKVGLVGQNGVGKTSLFKVILGTLAVESGEFFLPNHTLIGYVEQEIHNQNELLVDYVLSTHPLIVQDHTDLPEYYQLRPKAEKLLINLGFKLEELYLPIDNFSGGWQMRANLAKALILPSDLLLLDEPTNHLDLETVMWLEDWLKNYTGLAIIISHDREFLDNITTHTLLISGQMLTLYTGNYSTFENTRYLQIQQQQQLAAKIQAKREHLQKFVDRFKAKASKATQAQSRMKMIEKLQVAQAIPKDIEFDINFLEPVYQVDKLLSVVDASVGYPNNQLIENVSLDIFQNSRIGLLGKNGIGKSTFIKALIDGSTLLSGELLKDNKIEVGYFAQNTVDQLDLDDTPLSFLSREHKGKRENELRSFLGGYGFSGDKVKAKIGTFSGGEKARLTIANIILHRPNILFLDEPTNHLDMQMREELANGIQDFMGSVVIVSHDKFLLQSVVDEFYLIDNKSLVKFTGSLDDYHELLLQKEKDIERQQTSGKIKKNNNNPSNNKKANNKVKFSLEQIENKIKILQEKISIYENKISKVDYNNPIEIAGFDKATAEYLEQKKQLEDLETDWITEQA